MNWLGAAAGLAGAAAISWPAWKASAERRAVLTRWPTRQGVVAEANPVIDVGDDSWTAGLCLLVDTPEGRLKPHALPAGSEGDLQALAAAHPVGAPIVLRVNPKNAEDCWVDGRGPDTGSFWVFLTAIVLAGVSVAHGFGWVGPQSASFFKALFGAP